MTETLLLIAPYLDVVVAAAAALATMLVIGIGFLFSPSRTTLDWSFAAMLLMIAAFGAVVATDIDSAGLHGASTGVAAAAPVLLWSGMRALRGARDLAWTGGVFAVVAASVLVAAAATPWDVAATRGVFLASAAFAVLLVAEWAYLPRPRSACLLPLVVASAVVTVLILVAAVANPTVVDAVMSADVFAFIASVATILYLACVVVAAVAPPLHAMVVARRAGASAEWHAFERAAAATCRQAQEGGEACSLVYIQLDDAAEIHDTAGRATLAALSRRVEAEIRALLPPGTDFGQSGVGRFAALIRRPDADIRDLVREVLRRVSNIELTGRHIQPSASAGWAQTSTVGYEIGALIYMAREASAVASEKGGDRWERVDSTVIDRLLSEPTLR